MAKIKGICRNEECELCDQIQEAEKSNFVCSECGKDLMPFAGGDSKGVGKWWSEHKRQVLLLLGALVIIGGCVWGGLTLFSSKEAQTPPPIQSNTPKPAPAVADTTPTAPTEPVEVAVENKVKEEKTPAPVSSQKKSAEKSSARAQVQNGHGRVDLGYGMYEGDLKNGQPHGYGTITYTRRHKIVSSKDFVANPGDRFEGDFRDGRISGLGYWYHDGDQTAIKP